VKEKPSFVTDEHLEYLDELRESGATNMFGAAPFIEREFSVPIKEARQILSYWMETFSDRQKALQA
jgi:hypothetical protein